MCRQQGLEARTQVGVAFAQNVEKLRALIRGLRQRQSEQKFFAVLVHRAMVSARRAFSISAIVGMNSTRTRFCTLSIQTASSPVFDKCGSLANSVEALLNTSISRPVATFQKRTV